MCFEHDSSGMCLRCPASRYINLAGFSISASVQSLTKSIVSRLVQHVSMSLLRDKNGPANVRTTMIKGGKQVDSRAEAVVAVDSVAESAVAVDSVAESTISVDSTVEPIFAADTTFEPAPSLTIKPSDTTSESRYISQLQNSNTNPTSCQLQLRLFHQSLQIEALEKDLHKSQSRTSNLEIQVGDLKAKLKRQNVHVALLLGEMDLGEKLLDFQAHVEKLLRQEIQALMGEHAEDAQATVRFLDDVMLRLKVALVAERRKMEAEKAKWKE